MKVAFLTEFCNIGGGEKNLLYLSKEISKYVHVTVFSPEGKLFKLLLDEGINAISIRKPGKRWIKFFPFASFDRNLYGILKKFDVVHFYSLNTIPLYPLRLRKQIKVWTTHGFWEKPYGVRAKVINKFVDKVIAVSKDVYKICEFPERRKELIYPGVKIKNLDLQKKAVGDEINIGCIGRFQYIKGQDILLEAIRDVLKSTKRKKINLYFVGNLLTENNHDKKYMDFVKYEAKKIECSFPNLKVIFTGFVENVYDFLKLFHFLVVPSRYESFSVVTVEAMSYGIPVIVPNCGGVSELVDEFSGLIFEPENPLSLSKKIFYMISKYQIFNPCEIRNRALKFSVENQAKRHLEVYEQCLKELKS